MSHSSVLTGRHKDVWIEIRLLHLHSRCSTQEKLEQGKP